MSGEVNPPAAAVNEKRPKNRTFGFFYRVACKCCSSECNGTFECSSGALSGTSRKWENKMNLQAARFGSCSKSSFKFTLCPLTLMAGSFTCKPKANFPNNHHHRRFILSYLCTAWYCKGQAKSNLKKRNWSWNVGLAADIYNRSLDTKWDYKLKVLAMGNAHVYTRTHAHPLARHSEATGETTWKQNAKWKCKWREKVNRVSAVSGCEKKGLGMAYYSVPCGLITTVFSLTFSSLVTVPNLGEKKKTLF